MINNIDDTDVDCLKEEAQSYKMQQQIAQSAKIAVGPEKKHW
jgi:hypothetical protein